MNEFKESIKEQAEITFSEELRTIIKNILEGKLNLEEACREYGGKGDVPKDTKTLIKRIKQLSGREEEYFKLYNEYREKLSKRPRGYSYIVEILDMLENNLSQREIASDYGISRDTLKDAIKRIRKIYPDLKTPNTLYREYKESISSVKEEKKDYYERKTSDYVDIGDFSYPIDCLPFDNDQLIEMGINVFDGTRR